MKKFISAISIFLSTFVVRLDHTGFPQSAKGVIKVINVNLFSFSTFNFYALFL